MDQNYMKTIIIIIGTLASIVFSVAQGQVRFNNMGFDPAPIFLPDGVTPVGPEFAAELLGPGSTSIASTSFLGKGFFAGGIVTIPGADVGAKVPLTVRVWPSTSGSTFDQALGNTTKLGQSTFDQILGTSEFGAPPPTLTGMESFAVGIPEPPTKAMSILGAALLFITVFCNRSRETMGSQKSLINESR